MRHEREPFEGGSYDEPDGEDLGAELLEGERILDYLDAELVGDVGRDPFDAAQIND